MVDERVKKEIENMFEEFYQKKREQEARAIPSTPKESERKKLLRLLKGFSETPAGEPEPLEEQPLSTDTFGEEPETFKRNVYTYKDRPSRTMLIQANKDLLEKAKDEATKRQMSVASYIRECLYYRLDKTPLEKVLEIDNLLKECTVVRKGKKTLLVDGDLGFLKQAIRKGLTGKVWAFSQLDKLVPLLKQQSKETVKECLVDLDLDTIQTEYLLVSLKVVSEEQVPEAQKELDMPHAICKECHRPLTKEQFSLPNCPYCGERKGIEFRYDDVPEEMQSNPYAMCGNRECSRPLPKEAEKWKECKYCGTTEKEIVLKYEGVSPQKGISKETPDSAKTPSKEQAEKILETVAKSEVPEETEES